MTERKASMVVCDEVLFNLMGKTTISGMYTADIGIPVSELTIPQLIFFFFLECSASDPFKTLKLKVAFPGSSPNELNVPLGGMPIPTDSSRNIISVKQPFLIQNPVLRPGPIQTSVLHDKGEIDAGRIWITSTSV